MLKPFKQTFEQDTFGRVGDVFHNGNELYTVVLQVLAVDRHLVLVTGEPVELVDENVVPRFFVTIFQHTLEVLAVVVGACHSAVMYV